MLLNRVYDTRGLDLNKPSDFKSTCASIAAKAVQLCSLLLC